MKSNYTLTILFLFILFSSGVAQTSSEGYRLTVSNSLGTARNLGTGNSMFAIGPDFSAIGANPAGLGGYWKSEFTITGSIDFNHYTSSFSTDRNNIIEGNFNPFILPNVGFVIVNRPWNSAWKTSNFAVGFNRVADYRREIQFTGNPLGSITDSWRENANGSAPNQLNGFEEGLAYTSGAIYDFEEDHIYETDYALNPQYNLYKYESTILEGGKSELFLGYAANLDNKFLFGLSLNFPFVNYTENRIYSEIDGNDDGVPYFNDLEYYRFINSTGYGVNGKFGITYKPTKYFNLAFSAHTPTKFFMTDNFNTSLSYDYTDENHSGPILSESPYGSFQYALVTPWSLTGGIGIIAGDQGFIGASLKWTDYSSMHYDYSVSGNGNYYSQMEYEVNNDIRIQYGSAFNINMGGEMVLQTMRLRGGVSLAQSPYSNDNSFDPSYHAGIGFRAENYFVDFGYQLTYQDDGYLPYETTEAPQPLVITEYTKHNITATLGLKF